MKKNLVVPLVWAESEEELLEMEESGMSLQIYEYADRLFTLLR